MPQKKCEVIAIANQKGGVGKTTTTLSLGVALAKLGKKVLVIDADPQGDLTTCMGWYDQDKLDNTISSLMEQSIYDKPINNDDYILHHKENIDLLPSNIELSATEMNLVSSKDREKILKNCIEPLKDKYDYILIDCMPSLGMITINALACSDKIIIPVQSHYLSVKGMSQLLRTVSRVQRKINPNLKIGGILLTLVDARTKLSREMKMQLQEVYGNVVKIYDTQIPKAIKVAEATSVGESIFSYDKSGRVTEAYSYFAKEVVRNEPTRQKNASTKYR
ncbi:MAG: AAA family ATPase [bacterium]|nr:AAA family ATPase [bacterium]